MNRIDTPTYEPASRRVPSQQRSRERVERIVEVVTELVAAQGSDALRMSEVAQRAGISIGSLYQYFPDKAALIAALAERYNAEGRTCTARELAAVQTVADLAPALGRVTDGFYAMYRAAPAMRDIWAATQANKALLSLEAADGQAHTEMLEAVLARLRPDQHPADRTTLALLTMQLLATAVRLAITLDRAQGDAVIAEFKRMLRTGMLNAAQDC